MKIRMFLVLAFLCMGFATRASAQMYTADSDCSWDFSPDDGTIYTTATVEGQINVYEAPQGALHTYKVSTRLNGVAMNQSGGPTSDYVSVTNYQQATIVPGQLISFSCGETVVCNMMGPIYDQQDNYQIPVVNITMAFSGAPSPGDPNTPNYLALFAEHGLGGFFNNIVSRDCVVGYEAQGTVNPSNYSGQIQMQRDVVAQQIYINQTPAGGVPGQDNSGGNWTTTNPPTLWDLDATGWIQMLPRTPDTYRYRTFFMEQAYLPGTAEPVSAPQPFYTAVSCTTSGSQYVLVTDVPGDNQGAEGSIPLTWNLQ